VVFTSILLIDLTGLIYSTDLHYGMKVLRNNLPLFLLPLFLSTSPRIPVQLFHRFLLVYVAAVVAGTLNSTYLLINQDITDTRLISPLIHHIRFSLNVCLAIFITGFYIFHPTLFSQKIRLALVPALVWLVVFLFMLKSLSGILAFVVTVPVTGLVLLLQNGRKWIRIALAGGIMILLAGLGGYTLKTVSDYVTVDPVDLGSLDPSTSRGNPYVHDLALGVEEGRYVGLYICTDELREAWNQRSQMPFDSLDRKGQELQYTLIRYLSSKELRKDGDGMEQLTSDDVYYIENGIANANYLKKFSLKNRIHQMILAYRIYKEKGTHSGTASIERIEQASAAWAIFQNHWLIGVGTGDVPRQFQEQFAAMGSPLQSAQEGMFSAHNQFLNAAVATGIIGLIWFIAALLYPAVRMKRFTNYFFLTFFTIAVVSFLGDDTLKSQAGVTFIAFFYSLFVFREESIDL
jgi:hypothetical protein